MSRFKGKCPEEEIQAIKELYGKGACFSCSPTKDDKNQVIFKTINQELMDEITKMIADARQKNMDLPTRIVDDMIFDECVVWPKLTEDEKLNLQVGDVPSISTVIQNYSGFTQIDVQGNILGPATHVTNLKEFDYWGECSKEEVEKIKDKTPFQIFRVRIDRWVFIVRPMTLSDSKLAKATDDSSLVIVKSITLWPDVVEWDIIPAGIIDTLANVGSKISGWDNENDDISVTEI